MRSIISYGIIDEERGAIKMFLFFALVAAARLWSGSKILDEILSNLIVEQLTTILFLYAYTYSIFSIKQISFRCKYIRVNILWILQCLSKNHLQQRYFSTVLYPWNLCSSLLHKFGFVRQPSHQTEPSVFFFRSLPAMRDMSLILPVLTRMI